jgi:hypothetical protein
MGAFQTKETFRIFWWEDVWVRWMTGVWVSGQNTRLTPRAKEIKVFDLVLDRWTQG